MKANNSCSVMKTACCFILITAFSAIASAVELTEIERGPHSRTWQTVHQVETEKGVRKVTNTIEELQSGLHRWDNGWVVTDPKVELFQDGAVARNLQYSVLFAANLASQGATDILLPSGDRLTGQILGLAYVEGDKSALIAEIKDCVGEVGGAGHTEVTYRDAFTDFSIDVRYLVRRASFSQEILVKQRLPSPEEYGLSEKAVLMLLNEWTTFPQITKHTRLWQEGNAQQEPVTDEQISLGPMEFAPGKAFTIGGEKSFPVAKSFEQLEQRWFLLEKIPWKRIQVELAKLPAGEAKNRNGKPEALKQAKKGLPLPARRQAKKTIKPIQMAKADRPAEYGFLWDYDLVTSTNGFRFQRDKTYYIAGEVVMSGSNVFEGGCVLKFSPTNSARLNITGTVFCDSGSYAPIILTARDDHTVGESIGSASLSGFYASTAVKLGVTASGNTLKHVRFSYLEKALEFDTGGSPGQLNVAHAQFVKCRYPLRAAQPFCMMFCGATINLDNALAYDCSTFFQGDNGILRAQHLTVHQCGTLGSDDGYDSEINLTNTMLVTVTNWGNIASNLNATVKLDSDAGVFQTVGAGSHYLAANSQYRNAGTTNITASLLADLGNRTTYPPLVYSNVAISVDTVFSPQAQRDTDTPDLGFHAEPLDYAFGGVDANANLTFAPGTAVGWFRTSSGWYHAGHGIHIADGKRVTFDGRADASNYWVRCNVVQEGSSGPWQGGYGPGGITGWAGSFSQAPQIWARFTRCSVLANDMNHFRDDWGYLVINATHCAFSSANLGGYTMSPHFTNCFFDRVYVALYGEQPEISFSMRNCLMRGGSLILSHEEDPETPWTSSIRDSAFDGTSITVSPPGDPPNWEPFDSDYNAFQNGADRLEPEGTNDVLVSSFDWQTGPLGNYYQGSTNLLNKGSQTANLSGLYHFTTTTNQVKETNSTVDIGIHYVAVTNGVPFDTDSDGVPDYLEEYNGNGSVNSGETDWNSATDLGLKVRITQPKNNSTLP